MTDRADVKPVIAPPYVFLPHPETVGMWMRTDISVVLIDCPSCKAPVGEPCRGEAQEGGVVGVTAGTHYSRRRVGHGVKSLRMIDLARNKNYRFPAAAWWVAHEFEQHGFRGPPA